MITAKNGKRYLTSDDVMELVYNCKLTKKLEEIQRKAENQHLNNEEKPIKKGLFSKLKDTEENRTVMEDLGILPASKETMVGELQAIMEIVDKKWSDLITPGLYATGKEYDDVREHYIKLRGECWKTLSLVLNYSVAARCIPIGAWI